MNQPGGDPDLANLCYTRIHAVREKARSGPRSTAERIPDSSATPAARRADDPAQWTGSGVLRVAGFRVEGQPTYALVGGQGRVVNYAIAGPGVELERFRGYEVQLYGTVSHPDDLRGTGIITASQVRLPR